MRILLVELFIKLPLPGVLCFFMGICRYNQGKQYPRLLKQSDTSILVLQTWLVKTTLATQDRNTVVFLEDVVSLELWMALWVADSSAEFKMPEDQRVMVKEVFGKNFEILEKVCRLICPKSFWH